ncbi:DoxX family membrane protein [Povalibacter sp.]|uniref:DoxX family membrane protein n=1 Tax=Povalibacter sp. TaxID=1962978 RepID=UPI002F42BCF6
MVLRRNELWYGLGSLILGIVGARVGDFAMQWQPVPAGIPGRTVLAYLSALILIALGTAMLTGIRPRATLLAATIFYGLWVVLLHLPAAIANASQLYEWNGLAEILAITAGGAAGWALADAATTQSNRVAHIARLIFGTCLLVFGTSHFVYDDFSAGLIPGWLPAPLFWVYLTGAGHAAAGLAFLAGVATRLASTLLAAMFACFVLLLHLPRVLAHPELRVEWTMLGIAVTLTGAAWLLRATVYPSSSRSTDDAIAAVNRDRQSALADQAAPSPGQTSGRSSDAGT